ncbi:MAG: C45 family autoproteolytic acyltransferase/hydrolase [bacterium]|nr:C45 family autoproteolytic acyltransferase/hydrolase [bacterium]
MRRPPIRILDVAGSPGAMGHIHGATYADEIRAYAKERVELVAEGLWSGVPLDRGEVLEVAAACLEAHERQSAPLYEEMEAMAASAGISLAESVVVGGFTDFVDTIRAEVGSHHPRRVMEDTCTAFIVPDSRASGAGFFGQTWDMHASATDHVILMRTRPDDGPGAVVFTTTGCLGQIGMNELGVCVGINNLTAADGRRGVMWPTVIRQVLLAESAEEARDVILSADLAGGHNYLVFDGDGTGFNIEAMPTVRPVTGLRSEALVHTNHTTTADTDAVQGNRSPDLQESSRRRMVAAADHLDRRVVSVDDLMELTRNQVCQVSEPPYHIETSGAAVMRPKTADFWAVWGLPSMNDYVRVGFLS